MPKALKNNTTREAPPTICFGRRLPDLVKVSVASATQTAPRRPKTRPLLLDWMFREGGAVVSEVMVAHKMESRREGSGQKKAVGALRRPGFAIGTRQARRA